MSPVPTSNTKNKFSRSGLMGLSILATASLVLAGCTDSVGPASRNANVPAPKTAAERKTAVNENGEAIIYLPLGDDVLMPQAESGEPLPDTIIGPFELRGETLAGALQLILDDAKIPVAFESTSSLTQTITVTNLKGPTSLVVSEVCSLANMYCSYKNGILVVKDRQVFTVTIPPIVATADIPTLLTNIAGAVGNITGETPITDASTRTIVYRASQRTAEMATRYFQRLRTNTAMIVYETYIWEVSLDAGNTTGINWSHLDEVGKFNFGINLQGGASSNVGTPISIGLPSTGEIDFDTSDVFEFISSYGAVKTISQPQITVLSGSTASLRIADTQNYVASISRTTTDGGNTTVSTTTDSVDTGFTMEIGSNWDNSTVYGAIDILLQEVKQIDTFDENPDAVVQLPQTTERELTTQVRIRPGDLLLIAGLVKESDTMNKEGPGLTEPLFPTSRSAITANTELVFLLRPRVIVFTSQGATTPRNGGVALPQTSFTQPTTPIVPATESMASAEASPVPAYILPEPEQNIVSAPVVPQVVPESVGEPASNSIEIQPLDSVVADTKKSDVTENPSVIVNYDVLGR